MQTTQQISVDQLREIVAAVFGQGEVIVKQSYSDLDCATRQFIDAQSLMNDMDYQPNLKSSTFLYAIHYLEAKGYVLERRITLDPSHVVGHTFRFSQEGWGLIHLQCDFRRRPMVDCSIAVNSEARARAWRDTCPDFQIPSLWNWDVVQKKAGKLVRLLRKFGNENKHEAV